MTASVQVGPSPVGGGPAVIPHLSPRQLQIVRLAANGRTDQQIATALGLSIHTIRANWRWYIRDRLGAGDRTHAVALAITKGLVRPEEVHTLGGEQI